MGFFPNFCVVSRDLSVVDGLIPPFLPSDPGMLLSISTFSVEGGRITVFSESSLLLSKTVSRWLVVGNNLGVDWSER